MTADDQSKRVCVNSRASFFPTSGKKFPVEESVEDSVPSSKLYNASSAWVVPIWFASIPPRRPGVCLVVGCRDLTANWVSASFRSGRWAAKGGTILQANNP